MPVSNTSGVALAIMFQPLMNRYHQKIIQYAHGLERVNELILISLAVKEPESMAANPGTRFAPLKEGQVEVLDLNDPISFRSYVHFPPPLPLDKLIALNEVQTMLSLGLESKEGALRSLGEEFPDEKLMEIRQELIDDAKADGALNLVKGQIQQEIAQLTGMLPGPDGAPPQPMQGPEGQPMPGNPGAASPILDEAQMFAQMGEQGIRQRLVTEAYGTKIPQRRVPEEYEK
jgi:hypothetical protein